MGQLCAPIHIHEDDVALLQCRHENLLNIGEERRAIHRTVDHVGRGDAVDAQGGDERQRFPMPVRHFRDEPFADRCAPVEPRHLRGDRGFIEEQQTIRLELRLLGSQVRPRRSDIRPVLFGGVQDFF